MTRQHAAVGSAAGLVPHGHLGCGYRDRAEFRARAAEYIADGLAQRQWVEYVGAGSRDQLRAELATLPGIAEGSDIKVTPAREFYAVPPGTDIIDPDIALATRVAAVDKAVEQGYTGFRAAIDVTPVTRRPEQRDAHGCFEFLVDQKMTVLPASALCAYDLNQLSGDATGLICLHPYVGRGAPTFQLYAQPDAGFALTGELDAANAEVFQTALRRIWPRVTEDTDTVTIDASDLEFISHPPLLILDRHARHNGRHVVLRTHQRVPTRLVELLELTNVRVEPPAAGSENIDETAAHVFAELSGVAAARSGEDTDELPGGCAVLVVKHGPGPGSRFLLDRPVTCAGRDPNNDIYLDEATVSRRHAEFRREGSRFRIVDVGSLNGVYVNCEAVQSALLTDGDEIQVGKLRLIFLAR